MAYLCIVIDSNDDSIANLNQKCQRPTNPSEAVDALKAYLNGIVGGVTSASVQITTRDSDPSISTSGSGSEQEDYNLE